MRLRFREIEEKESDRWHRGRHTEKETINQWDKLWPKTLTTMLSVFCLIMNADMESSHLCLYADIVWMGMAARVQAALHSDFAEAISGSYKWGQWGHGDVPARADWVRSTHITKTITVWPCLMQRTLMIDNHCGLTSRPQYLIKYQPNIQCPQMSWDPEELTLLLVMNNGEVADRLDELRTEKKQWDFQQSWAPHHGFHSLGHDFLWSNQ